LKKIVLSDKKEYGPSSSFTFISAKPDPAVASKKLAQATLNQTMKRYRAIKNDEDDGVFPAAASGSPPPASVQRFSDDVGLPFKGDVVNPAFEGLHSISIAKPFRPSNVSGVSSVWQSRSAARSLSPLSFQTAQQALASTAATTAAAKMHARSLFCGSDDSAYYAFAIKQRWPWLQNRRDATGKSPEDPAYDPRTILISSQEFSRLKGFNAQYWSIKRDAMDLVLFVRVGSFYELYDLDADVGLRIGLNPMGSIPSREANMWKVGCTAGAFHQWASKVLALGYSVGRVEECRGSRRDVLQHVGGRKLVARKLVQIYTPGTMLDNFRGGFECNECAASQPFIALFEGSNGLFGCCVVDVPSATVAISQWQEVDVARSMLVTLLNQANPVEILILGPHYISTETRKALKRHKPLVADGIERPLAVTLLRRLEFPFVSEDPDEVPALLEGVESAYFIHGGNVRSFQAASETLCSMPHAAAAFWMAIAHLASAGVASHVLPHATISFLASFTPQGARTTGHMLLDSTTVSSLELIEGGLGGIKGSLLSYLAAGAASAAGHRRIKEWILSPLYRVGDINERLDVVSAFMQLPEALGAFQTLLLKAPDCERLMPKVATLLAAVSSSHGSSMKTDDEDNGIQDPAEVENTGSEDAPAVRAGGASLSTARFLPAAKLFEGLGLMMEAVCQLQHAVNFQRSGGAAALPPLSRALCYGSEIAKALESLSVIFHSERFVAGEDCGLTLQPGFCPKYDDACDEVASARAALDEVVELERKALGAATSPQVNPVLLRKIKLVEVSGDLVLEVPLALKGRLSDSHSVIKETKTVIRVATATATAAAAKLSAAKDAAEDAVLCSLAQSAELFLETYHSFLGFCASVASLDALAAFAERTHPNQSAGNGCTFCRPVFTAHATAEDQNPPLLNFQGLWNPQLLLSEITAASWKSRSRGSKIKIQPNDLILGGDGNISSTLLITGANTGGKSTLLRSACLAVILAQVGAFVPCSACTLAPVDRILLRMGAQDRISAGESTFCMEMTETSAVLRHAQPSSLVILDELGRGTSTHDGNAIAAAVAWWLTRNTRCRMLFATHYHGLTRDPDILASGAISGHMSSAVDKHGLVPSYKLNPGAAPEGSCGLAVAKSAGLPAKLVQRAEQIATKMECDGEIQLDKLRDRAIALFRGVADNGEIVKIDVANVQTAIRQALMMEL
jgi:DNA mismatch repair protein MSH6